MSIFKKPYGYKEAFILATLIAFAGFALEIFFPSTNLRIPGFPYNVILLLVFVLIIIFSYLFLIRNYFISWLTSIEVAIALIATLTILVLIMALVPQSESGIRPKGDILGFTTMKHNWALIFVAIVTLYVVGLIIIKRLLRGFDLINIIFLLNHIGIWLIIAGALFGSGDFYRLRMTVMKDAEYPQWQATDLKGNLYSLKIAVELLQFDIDYYPPKIGIIDNHTGQAITNRKLNTYLVEPNKTYKFDTINVKILEYIPNAVIVGDSVFEFYDLGSAPAARVKINNHHNSWLFAGSFLLPPKTIEINKDVSLALFSPEPKKYYSKLVLYSADETIDTVELIVNKPVKFKGWDIYLLSYDEDKGQWSDYVTLELVYDPWLPVVYTGIFMLLIGSVLIYFVGIKNKQQ